MITAAKVCFDRLRVFGDSIVYTAMLWGFILYVFSIGIHVFNFK